MARGPSDGVGKDVSLDSKLHSTTLPENMLSMSRGRACLNTGTGGESGMKRGTPVTCVHSGWRDGGWSIRGGRGVVVVVGVVESVEEVGFAW